MSEDRSRWTVMLLVLLCAIPMQAAAIWLHPFNTWLDWLVLGALLLLGYAQLDGKAPE